MRLAVGLAVLGGCDPTPTDSGGGCTPTATGVCMSGSQFVPLNLTVDLPVDRGVTVTWTNGDEITHRVTSAEGSAETFDSQNISGGGSFHWTFNRLGTFRYFCQFHSAGGPAPTGMHGTITVK